MSQNELLIDILKNIASQQQSLYDLTVSHYALLEATKAANPNLGVEGSLQDATSSQQARDLLDQIQTLQNQITQFRSGMYGLT